jgi:hypothetical protein
LYKPFGFAFNFTFGILSNFCIIFCLALTHIYKQKAEEAAGLHQIEAAKTRQLYSISVVICLFLAVPWVIFYITPYYVNLMLDDSATMTEEVINMFKLLNYIAAGCYLIAWCM